MEPYDLGDDPNIAATIVAEQMGCDPESEFVVADEFDEGQYREMFRGNLIACIKHLEFTESVTPLAIIEAEVFDQIKPTIN